MTIILVLKEKKYEPVIIRILEKVNHELLDLKTIFYFAFCKRCLDVVTLLLENTDHEKSDLKEAMSTTVNTTLVPWNFFTVRMIMNDKIETNESLFKLVLEKLTMNHLH